jgi:hypothetical protein
MPLPPGSVKRSRSRSCHPRRLPCGSCSGARGCAARARRSRRSKSACSSSSHRGFNMSTGHLLVWNVCGLNSRAQRDVVREFVVQHRVSVLCVQETKVANFTVPMLHGLTGSCFDYMCLPAVGASGGALVAWRRDL